MLGSGRATVRMAGLYALERLAQDQPAQRRPVVSLLCAYLRMPYQDPDEPRNQADDDGVDQPDAGLRRERMEEVEVRYAVQALLRTHVHSGPQSGTEPSREYWGDDLDVPLMGATLLNLYLNGRRIHPSTKFSHATFVGPQNFAGVTFSGPTWFSRATFTDEVTFDGATFAFPARFDGATFPKKASFSHTQAVDGFDLGGARAAADEDHVWPEGWSTRPATGSSPLVLVESRRTPTRS